MVLNVLDLHIEKDIHCDVKMLKVLLFPYD